MRITKSQLQKIIKEELNEVTQGEMEFAELEAAREAYLENRRDDEIRHQFGMQVEKLVEPIMSELGFYLQAEAFYSQGKIVFESFDPRIDVTIEPAGAMGRYDVGVYPMDESLTFSPIEMSVDTMKGALQFISDTLGETGMVGEPEAQAELPLGRRGVSRLPKWRRTAKEHKMRITKSQLQQVIREEVKRLKESSSRFEVELYLKDVAESLVHDLRQATVSGRTTPKSVESALVEFFMDKIDGPEHPIAKYAEFLRELALSSSHELDPSDQTKRQEGATYEKGSPSGIFRMENKTRITKSQLQQVVKEELAAAINNAGGNV